ncbi:MAG: hypothetical protein HQM08_28330 [Candidatus Riflebacteria bacterium]|nr:hypothetical protein [Candidatus Riflebacteria bacterium]
MDKKFKFFLILCFLSVFAKFFLSSGETILSARDNDIRKQFLDWRDFGFSELAKGHLPLWNPHIFCGAPYFGGFQSALLYPPNWVHFFLPVHKAINFIILFHILLIGFFTYFWNRSLGCSDLGSTVAAFLFMFSGSVFCRIFAGHLSNICTMSWMPLVFLAFEWALQKRERSYCLLGIFAISMQILSGHMQYVYYNALILGFYALIRAFSGRNIFNILKVYFIFYFGAVLICSFQLVAGFNALLESARGGSKFQLAFTFSLPPENLLTFIFPWIFGHINGALLYWGSWLPWEVNLHFGVSGFCLALFGIFCWKKPDERKVAMILSGLFALLLALGDNTPIYEFLSNWLPGFSSFRGCSKFGFFAVFFLCSFASIGMDFLSEDSIKRHKFAAILFLLGIICFSFGLFIYISSRDPETGIWPTFVNSILSRKASLYFLVSKVQLLAFISLSGMYASLEVFFRALIIFSGALFLLKSNSENESFSKRLALLVILEICIFAGPTLEFFDISLEKNIELKNFVSEKGNEYRFALPNPVKAMTWNVLDVNGDDPFSPKRYSEFLAFSQDLDPDSRTTGYYFLCSPLLRLASCKYFVQSASPTLHIREISNVLPRALILHNWKTMKNREEIFAEFSKRDFNPLKSVLIEEDLPELDSIASNSVAVAETTEKVEIKNISTDEIFLNVKVEKPAILLITDSYTPNWVAETANPDYTDPGNPKMKYRVIPANYAFRGIPLIPGEHKIKLSYQPAYLKIAMIFNIFAVFAFLTAVLSEFLKLAKRKDPFLS